MKYRNKQRRTIDEFKYNLPKDLWVSKTFEIMQFQEYF